MLLLAKKTKTKYGGEDTTVVIGDRNVIREAVVQIHRGTVQDKATTIVGNDNLLCVNAYRSWLCCWQ